MLVVLFSAYSIKWWCAVIYFQLVIRTFGCRLT